MKERHNVPPEFWVRVNKLPTLEVNGYELTPINRTSNDSRKNGFFLLTSPIKWAIPGGGEYVEPKFDSRYEFSGR